MTDDFTPASVFNLTHSNSIQTESTFTSTTTNNNRYTVESAPGALTRVTNTLTVYAEDKRILALMCLFAPPLAVFITTGGASRKMVLSLFLYLFFIIPGTLDENSLHYFFWFYICFQVLSSVFIFASWRDH